MDEYDRSAFKAAQAVTTTFSTSFSMASRFFDVTTRQNIYNIYGLVRIADEIVDTYQGQDKEKIITQLEDEVYVSLERGYSANIIVHAFVVTARKYDITKKLITPFFDSMKMDLMKTTFNEKEYRGYIYGSAEVIGLMCLKVFVDSKKYHELESGASALGAAFQKINFLRDIKDDYEMRGRYYFPLGSYNNFSDAAKDCIITDIEADLVKAKRALVHLPRTSRKAVAIALRYYELLLTQLKRTSTQELKKRRVRIPNYRKAVIAATEVVKV